MSTKPEVRQLKIERGDAVGRAVTVAHISDLHFTAGTNTGDAVFHALEIDLVKQRPDVLAVTGDLIDNSVWDWLSNENSRPALAKTRDFLVGLCRKCGLDPDYRLVIIPGNHDYRIKGNVFSASGTALFREMFASEFQHRLLLPLGIAILSFDSNPFKSKIELATGAVDANELLDAVDAIKKLEPQDQAAWNAAARIALLHHHPMPIAATQNRNLLTEVESFLLLRNAGLFMTEMVDQKVDLILHGHRHYPAFSRATFDAGAGEHTLAVLASGSVTQSELHPLCYNLVRFEENGEIIAERRALTATQYNHEHRYHVRDYREARELRYRLSLAGRQLLRATRYSRQDVIQRDSGDDAIHECFEGVVSLNGDPIDHLRSRTSSRSGYFSRREYAPEGVQKITWSKEDVQADGSRDVVTKFDPPIASSPIAYSRSGVFTNAIYFSRQDRLDATRKESSEESVISSTIHAYDSMSLSVSFPPQHFPKQFRIEVRSPDGKADHSERAFVVPHLAVLPAVHTVTFSMERPMPGCEYGIVWDLPQDLDANLKAADSGRALEIAAELSAKKNAGELRRRLAHLCADFGGLCRIDLFVPNSEVGGLLPAASNDAETMQVKEAIRSGVGPVGRAFRRRAVIVTIPISQQDPAAFEPEVELNPFPHSTRSIIAVPLYYPMYTGKRLGVLTIRSEANDSPLNRALDESQWVLALHDRFQNWFIQTVRELAGIVDWEPVPVLQAATAGSVIDVLPISDVTHSARVSRHQPLDGRFDEIMRMLSA